MKCHDIYVWAHDELAENLRLMTICLTVDWRHSDNHPHSLNHRVNIDAIPMELSHDKLQ
jgi:hypothetical protein